MKHLFLKVAVSASFFCLLGGCGGSSSQGNGKNQNVKSGQVNPKDDLQVDQWIHLLCSVKTQSRPLEECFPTRAPSDFARLSHTLNQYEQFGRFPFSFTQTHSFQTRYRFNPNETNCFKSRFCQEIYE